jgi:hypothetical protein
MLKSFDATSTVAPVGTPFSTRTVPSSKTMERTRSPCVTRDGFVGLATGGESVGEERG